jgi:hypothetical protein
MPIIYLALKINKFKIEWAFQMQEKGIGFSIVSYPSFWHISINSMLLDTFYGFVELPTTTINLKKYVILPSFCSFLPFFLFTYVHVIMHHVVGL